MRNQLVPLVLALALAACADKSQPAPVAAPAPQAATAPAPTPAVPTPSQAPSAALTRVEDPSTVCMVNDQYMGNKQIPVAVDGKTYYGCCQMCEARLNKDPSARLAEDPVSKRQVDKATAVIAKDTSGKVLYFESEASLRAYTATL